MYVRLHVFMFVCMHACATAQSQPSYEQASLQMGNGEGAGQGRTDQRQSKTT